MYIVYVKTQLQKLRKIGLNRTYNVLKRFFQLQQLRKIIVIDMYRNGAGLFIQSWSSTRTGMVQDYSSTPGVVYTCTGMVQDYSSTPVVVHVQDFPPTHVVVQVEEIVQEIQPYTVAGHAREISVCPEEGQ